MWKAVMILAIWAGSASLCDAQLFRRSQVRYSNTRSSGGHWSYPGRIEDHLAGFHGQNIAGLSHEQLLELHDAIHEGRQVRQLRVMPCSPPKVVVQAVRSPAMVVDKVKRTELVPVVPPSL